MYAHYHQGVGCMHGKSTLSTPSGVFCFGPVRYTEKATDAWHRHGRQKHDRTSSLGPVCCMRLYVYTCVFACRFPRCGFTNVHQRSLLCDQMWAFMSEGELCT